MTPLLHPCTDYSSSYFVGFLRRNLYDREPQGATRWPLTKSPWRPESYQQHEWSWKWTSFLIRLGTCQPCQKLQISIGPHCKLLKNIQCLMEEHVHVSHCLVPFFFGLGKMVRSPASWNLARRWRLRIACFCPVLLLCHISCIQDSSQDHWTLIWGFDIIQKECLGKRTQILPLFSSSTVNCYI